MSYQFIGGQMVWVPDNVTPEEIQQVNDDISAGRTPTRTQHLTDADITRIMTVPGAGKTIPVTQPQNITTTTKSGYVLPVEMARVYDESSPEDKFSILKAQGAIPPDTKYAGTDGRGEPIIKKGGGLESFVMSPAFRETIVESTVPLVYTVGNWRNMSAGERVLSLALDSLFFLPFIGAAGRGARATTAVTRAGRFTGSVAGVGSELLAQARAPIDILIHPIASVKGTGKLAWDSLENIFSLKKLPEAVVTTTEGTMRIPIGKGISASDAVQVRNKLVTAAASTGSDIAFEFNGNRYTLSRSALSKKLGGSLSHTTPSGEAFIDGAKIKSNIGKPLSEQGLFVSPEPLPRFTKGSAYGKTGETSSILITSSDTAKDAIQTGKIYKSHTGPVTELEMKFPVGYTITEPKQILYTRIGPERYKTLLLLEKPLSKSQRLKLKSLAMVEDLKAPFKPALLIEKTDDYVKGVGKFTREIDDTEIRQLARILDESGNRNVARNVRAAYKGIESARSYNKRETDRQLATSKRIGSGTISRGDGRDAVQYMFDVYAEKIGRSVRVDDIKETPQPIRITNKKDETPRATRTDEDIIPPPPRPPRRGKDEEPPPRPPRRGKDEEPPPRPPRRFISPSYQQQSREEIKTSSGAIAWRMGKLSGKDRWDVVVNPYSSNEYYYMVLGKQPEGATILKRGERSAYGTTQVIKGEAPKREIKVDSGFVDVTISPTGKKSVKMKVTPDPKMETTGDITIGRNKTRISDKPLRISGRSGRISPKMPKLK